MWKFAKHNKKISFYEMWENAFKSSSRFLRQDKNIINHYECNKTDEIVLHSQTI